MTFHRKPRRAAVLAAALRSWVATTTDDTGMVAQLVVREAPNWAHLSSEALTDRQITRLLAVLREDLVPDLPTTPVQASATFDQILAEWKAEGRTRIRPEDLNAALPRIGRSRVWLAQHLIHLVDAGYLRETRRAGTYRI